MSKFIANEKVVFNFHNLNKDCLNNFDYEKNNFKKGQEFRGRSL